MDGWRFTLMAALAGTLAACLPVATPAPSPPLASPTTFGPATPRPTITPVPTYTPDVTATPLLGATTTPAPSPTPFGCGQAPPQDPTRIIIRDHTLNQRTLSMLAAAQTLYDGPNDLLLSITQGSYNEGVEASFGTHDGGGAVDLSIYNQGPEAGLLDAEQIQALVEALRRAGFAAWLRAPDDLYAGSPPHIHAIAIGDAELSVAAAEQLTGPNGYFRGRNGLPSTRDAPDRHGGPIVCPWMVAMGYADLRENAP